MTLVAPHKPATHSKKHSGKHHRQTKAYHKAYWPYLPMIAIVVAGFLLNSSPWLPGKHAVLGYATDISIQSLLADTNTQRINNGIAALALNGLLDNAAQAKANDMAARDYWSHNTPDNQTPWTFMDAAGYNYQLAGENLAYGFTTSADTLTGWMNSPGHRANILNGGYVEVGFGIANIPNYQNSGPETLVVAMYGAPASGVAAAPAPAAPAPAAVKPATTQSSGSATTPAAGTPADATPAENESTATDTDPTPSPTSDVVFHSATPLTTPAEPKQTSVTRGELLTAAFTPANELALASIAIVGLAVFLLRHGLAWHKFLRRGERFVIKHPLVDMLILTVTVLAVVFGHSAGVIR